ncbi:hypothetical protein ACFX15_019156 [Malus domestica]
MASEGVLEVGWALVGVRVQVVEHRKKALVDVHVQVVKHHKKVLVAMLLAGTALVVMLLVGMASEGVLEVGWALVDVHVQVVEHHKKALVDRHVSEVVVPHASLGAVLELRVVVHEVVNKLEV